VETKEIRSKRTKPTQTKLIAAVCAVAICAAAGSVYVTTRQEHRAGEAAYERGMEALKSGDALGAETAFLDGTRQDPNFAPCFSQLGGIYLRRREYDKALPVCKRAAELAPDDGNFWLVLSTVDVEVHDLQEAEVAAQRAATLMPKDPDVIGQLASVENKLKHNDNAYDAYRKAHELQPDNPDYLITLARYGLSMTHDVDQLTYQERELGKYLQAHPTDADAAKVMEQTVVRLPPTPERLANGVKYALVTKAAYPRDADVDADLGQLYQSSNHPLDAIAAYTVALAAKPTSTHIMQSMMVCYLKIGRRDRAEELSKRIQKLSQMKANGHS